MANLKTEILDKIKKRGKITAVEIIKSTGFSRAYVNRFFQQLKDEGKIVLLGKANRAHYVLAESKALTAAKAGITDFRKILKNKNLSEDTVLAQIKKESGIFFDLKKNVSDIIDYAFLEMLNNAIEHSKSPGIEVKISRSGDQVIFYVVDYGIGAFNSIKKKKNLTNELAAIQDLLKGKQTTDPKAHSGEGIFFTSKLADNFTIASGRKKLIFNNLLADVFINDIKGFFGTKVIFVISEKSNRQIKKIFADFAGDNYEFAKTKVAVRLYKIDSAYISRSQARRLVSGLDNFKTVVLDFKNIATVGQAFADEIFRVWQSQHPGIKISVINSNENIDLMISRAKNLATRI